MIRTLHPSVLVLALKAGASPQDLQALQSRFPELPASFSALFSEATEIELSYKGKYLRLYGPMRCAEMDDAYGVSEKIPGAVPVGDNGGGEAIIFLPRPDRGVYRVGYGSLALEETIYIARSLEALLCEAEAEGHQVGGIDA